jgi:dTDP-glucose 4,6-dehydratase
MGFISMKDGSRKVLVAGCAGFVGSHLVDSLLERGHQVVGVDNLITGNLQNLSSAMSNSKFEFFELDISSERVIPKHPHFDLIYHLASPASPVDYLKFPLETLKSGSLGTMNLCELALSTDARLILASTSEVYGDPLINPQIESYWGNVNPIGPRSVYDEAKRFSESVLMAYNRKYSLNVGIVRIFNTYGPRMAIMDGRAVPNFSLQAIQNLPISIYGDGSQTRSLCYVDDLIKGLIDFSFLTITGPVNLGNPVEVTMKHLAELIRELCESNSTIDYMDQVEDDPKVRCPDVSLAKEMINWDPKWDLREGLMSTIDWYRKELVKVKDGKKS